MPRNVLDLINDGIKSISLNILVFGPQVHPLSTDERTRNLQNKRKEIRAELEKQGHNVRYGEELVEPNLPDPEHNEFIQELVIMEEYDLIVALVDSPGSITEATLIASKPQLASKSALFMDGGYKDGLVAKACMNAKNLGAFFQHYTYPDDLVNCHLLTHVVGRAKQIRLAKFLS